MNEWIHCKGSSWRKRERSRRMSPKGTQQTVSFSFPSQSSTERRRESEELSCSHFCCRLYLIVLVTTTKGAPWYSWHSSLPPPPPPQPHPTPRRRLNSRPALPCPGCNPWNVYLPGTRQGLRETTGPAKWTGADWHTARDAHSHDDKSTALHAVGHTPRPPPHTNITQPQPQPHPQIPLISLQIVLHLVTAIHCVHTETYSRKSHIVKLCMRKWVLANERPRTTLFTREKSRLSNHKLRTTIFHYSDREW